MSKYIFIYKENQTTDVADIPEEEVKKVMEAWGEWLGNMGDKVVDPGEAFAPQGKMINQGNITDTDGLTSGYTIVEAASFDEAVALAQKNPSVEAGSSVEIYEAFGL